MSGMSADGLDLALVRLSGLGPRPGVDLVATRTVAYDAALRARIRGAITGGAREVSTLSFVLARAWAGEVRRFLSEIGVGAPEVDVLGSHGQTIDHVPRGAGPVAATLQIGDGNVLAFETGIVVVSDFRPADVAAGGEGAPLVPFADWVRHAAPGRTRVCVNLGSIANATVVSERLEDVFAFDTGPANALLDGLCRARTGDEEAIDRDGTVSAGGRVRDDALRWLEDRARAFLDRPPPRSAGYDEFGPSRAVDLARAFPGVSLEDLARTAVEHTARTLAGAFERWILPRRPGAREAWTTGGGARNPTLLGRVRETLGALGVQTVVEDDAWVDGKEAVAFALLADATARGLASNVPGATGAARAVLLGKIALPSASGGGGGQ